MADLFAAGSIVDLILLLVLAEAAMLLLVWRVARRGVAPADLVPNLLAGAALLVALRLVQSGADWRICCAALGGAGLAHLADLRRRWRS